MKRAPLEPQDSGRRSSSPGARRLLHPGAVGTALTS